MAEYINRGTAIAKLTALQVIGPNTTSAAILPPLRGEDGRRC